jgi:hypothetical protein
MCVRLLTSAPACAAKSENLERNMSSEAQKICLFEAVDSSRGIITCWMREVARIMEVRVRGNGYDVI